VLRLLERDPTATLPAQASRPDLLAVARASQHRQPQRLADKVADALAADHVTPRAYLARAKADTIRLAATQLLGLAPSGGRGSGAWAHCCWARPAAADGHQLPTSAARRSLAARSTAAFPGLVTASPPGSPARSATTSTHFASPNALACSAGTAPVTRRSGKHQFVVARRLAHNRALGNAVHQAVPTAAWPDTTVTPTIRTPTRR
jgi:hypothetical protein